MAATPVEIQLASGLTGLVLKLFALGSDTQANPTGGGDALTEETNRKGTYTATVDEALDGVHTANVMLGSSLVENGYVHLHDTTARCHVRKELPVSVDGKTEQEAMQIIAAATAGKLSGAGTATEVMKGLDGSTTRITGTVDGSGNRTAATYG